MTSSPGDSVVKNPPANAGDMCSIPASGRSMEKERQSIPGLLPGRSHEQRGLVGYSPCGRRERHDLVTQQQQNSVLGNSVIPCVKENSSE